VIPYVDIYIKSPVNFYEEYELTEDELSWLFLMFEEGNGQDATDIFIQQFILPPSTKYQDVILSYMGVIDSGLLEQKEENKLVRNITLLSLGLIALLKDNYSKYIKSVYAPQIFKNNNLDNAGVKDKIIDEVLSKFDESIQATFSQSDIFIVNSIRTLQREMLAENFRLMKTKVPEEAMDVMIKRFKASLRNKYPEIYKAMEEGNIIVTSRMTDTGIKFMHFKIDYYVDMSVRTTLLNADRTTVEIMALANDEKIVEYYLSDNRAVNKDRDICQKILSNKIYGMSLLATDDITAKKLGIYSIQEAKSTPDYIFSYGCRHNIRRLPRDFLNRIDELLKEAA
jgi:hypothetical protein